MQNDMRDRLVKVIMNCKTYRQPCTNCKKDVSCSRCTSEYLADHLIANDVQEVKQATWTINPDGYYPYCSNCNYEPDRPRTHSDNRTPYCPNCGAKMKKEWE